MDTIVFFILCSLLRLSLAGKPPTHEDHEPEAFHHFVTRPDIEAPKWRIETYDEEALQQGHYWFVSPYLKLEQDYFPMWNGPYIYRPDGVLVWSGAPLFSYENVQDFRVSHVNGQPMLSFVRRWAEEGPGWIYDNTYNLYKVLDTNTKANMHDFNIVDNGERALMITDNDYTPTHVELGNFKGECPAGWQGFNEIDVRTGETVFDWHAKGHVTLEECAHGRSIRRLCNPNGGWDTGHINAVDKFPDGDYLLSVRNANMIIKIDHRDQSIVWRLGGIKSDFEFGPGAIFQEQHHARVRSQNETHTLISVFNNAPRMETEYNITKSWGLLLSLRTDVTPMRAELVQHYGRPSSNKIFAEHALSVNRGSISFLPNGNAFLGWVENTQISEHAPDGRLLQQAALLKGNASTYRSYKMPWTGWPQQPPDVVARVSIEDSKLFTIVYVSWNGATEVASWNVLHTTSTGNASQLVASEPAITFETRLAIPGYAEHVVVVGMDAHGQELGRSNIVIASVPDTLDDTVVGGLEANWLKTHAGALWSSAKGHVQSNWAWVLVIAAFTIAVVAAVVFRKRLSAWIARRRGYEHAADYEVDVLMDDAESQRRSKWALDSVESDDEDEGDVEEKQPPRYSDTSNQDSEKPTPRLEVIPPSPEDT